MNCESTVWLQELALRRIIPIVFFRCEKFFVLFQKPNSHRWLFDANRHEASLLMELFLSAAADYSHGMATTGKTKYLCSQCDMSESRCECEKYCCLCQSQIDIRLCEDGLYYCPPCREACDYKTAD